MNLCLSTGKTYYKFVHTKMMAVLNTVYSQACTTLIDLRPNIFFLPQFKHATFLIYAYCMKVFKIDFIKTT